MKTLVKLGLISSGVCVLIALIIIGIVVSNQGDDWINIYENDSLNPCADNERVKNFPGIRLGQCVFKGKPRMFTGENTSRLGNKMHLYADLFAIATYNNCTDSAYMSPIMSDHLSEFFNVSLGTLNYSLYSNIPWTNIRLGGKVPDGIKNISIPLVRFGGAPQVWLYYHEIRPLILQELRFYDHITQRSKVELQKIKENVFKDKSDILTTTLVGIHVRRGDYVESADYAHFYIPPLSFYHGAMDYFIQKYENVIFVVSTNDPRWCEENFTPGGQTDWGTYQVQILKGASEKNGGLDMSILVECDHVIFGVGSFGFWAGYLNRGEVIYCSDCFTSESEWVHRKLIFHGNYSSAVLPEWVGFARNGTQRSELASSDILY